MPPPPLLLALALRVWPQDIDLRLAQAVAKMVGGGVPHEGRPNHGRKAPGLSQTDLMPPKPTIKTRRVAVLIADGFELSVLSAVCTALKAEGATTWLIAPRRGPVFPTGADRTAGTGGVMADHHLEGQRSTAFDAIFVCPGAASILTLREVRQIFFPHLFPHIANSNPEWPGCSLGT